VLSIGAVRVRGRRVSGWEWPERGVVRVIGRRRFDSFVPDARVPLPFTSLIMAPLPAGIQPSTTAPMLEWQGLSSSEGLLPTRLPTAIRADGLRNPGTLRGCPRCVSASCREPTETHVRSLWKSL
jgi:hypothetical protein